MLFCQFELPNEFRERIDKIDRIIIEYNLFLESERHRIQLKEEENINKIETKIFNF